MPSSPSVPPGGQPLPNELASVLLTMAAGAVPVSLVSRLSRNLSAALGGLCLPAGELVRLAAMLSRATGPWIPSRRRFVRLQRELEALLVVAGCAPDRVRAVVADVREGRQALTRGY
jgi:hypothetical protein